MSIADACIREEQKEYVNFEPYYTHIVCHECCHGIGPHSITLPSGKKSTVRLVRTQTAILKITGFSSTPIETLCFPSEIIPFYQLLPSFQTIGVFVFSTYIIFTMYVDIAYIHNFYFVCRHSVYLGA